MFAGHVSAGTNEYEVHKRLCPKILATSPTSER